MSKNSSYILGIERCFYGTGGYIFLNIIWMLFLTVKKTLREIMIELKQDLQDDLNYNQEYKDNHYEQEHYNFIKDFMV